MMSHNQISDLNIDDEYFANMDDSEPLFDVLNCKSLYITEDKLRDFFNFKNRSALNVLHINCRSLNKNFESIKYLLSSLPHSLTAVGVTETWLTDIYHDSYILPGYNFIAKSRLEKSGGGVGIFLSDIFVYKERTDLSRMCPFIECLIIEIVLPSKSNILVGCVYRPPNTDVTKFNDEMLSILKLMNDEKNKLCLVMGDFNLDLMKSEVHAQTGEFLNNMQSHSFFPTIKNPTRISDQSATLIDNIFINCVKEKFSSGIVYSDISDHLPIAIHLDLNIVKKRAPVFIKKRLFDAKSIEHFLTHISCISWNQLIVAPLLDDPSVAYDCFFNIYRDAFDLHFPEKIIKCSNKMTPKNEWMTKGLMKSCIKKSKLYKIYKQKCSPENKKRYIEYRNKLKSLLNKAETNFYSKKFQLMSGNMRETWKLIGSILNTNNRSNLPDSFIIDGIKNANHNDIVDKFNDYFVNIGSRLASSIPNASKSFSEYMHSQSLDSFSLYLTDANEIIQIVSNFQNKSSAGVDAIPINIMKESICYIAEPISNIINSSLITGIFPDSLKIGKICPIYKSGETDLFANYRPISILPSFSKIFEKIVFNRLSSYLDKNCVLVNNQYGFRRKHSTYMAIMDMYDSISQAVDKNEFAVGIFIDLSKAFDTLNHDILLSKLELYGIRGVPLQWFKNYLSNRKQFVSINGVSSTLSHVNCGVPQGSILGPLLFILYINDIVNCSHILKFILFADDTNLFYSGKDIWQVMQCINAELLKLSEWFRANKLSLNVKKTNFILFGRKRIISSTVNSQKFQLIIDGNVLDRVDCTKFLGVIIDEKLNWYKHIDHISLKISRALGILNRIKNVMPHNVLLMIYNTLISPYLTYCNIIWCCAKPTLIKKMVVLQKRAVRLITRSSYRTSTGPLFRRLKLLRLMDIHKFQISLFMFKYKYSVLPASCQHYVKVNVSKHYAVRKSKYFFEPSCRTNIRENSISVCGPRLWNSLPVELQSCTSIGLFKTELSQFYISFY